LLFVNIATDDGSPITEYTSNIIKLTKAGCCLPRRTESWRKEGISCGLVCLCLGTYKFNGKGSPLENPIQLQWGAEV